MIPKNLKIIKTLGRGSYAEVYLVLDVNTHKYYALKNLVINNKNSIKDVTREIEFYMMFNHPNIIKIYDYFVDKDEINILLEYAPYGTLEQYLNKYKENINEWWNDPKVTAIKNEFIFNYSKPVMKSKKFIFLKNFIKKLK